MSWTTRRPRYQDVLAAEGKRACPLCKETLNLDDFYTSKTNKHGRSRYCKTCKPKPVVPLSVKKEHVNETLFKIGYLWCPSCKKPCLLDEFYINNSAKYGRTRTCKVCDDAARNAREKSKPDEQRKLEYEKKKKALEDERDAMGIRTCRRCVKIKSHEEFKADASLPYGIQRICRTCDNLWTEQRRTVKLLRAEGFPDELINKFIRRIKQAKIVKSCEFQEKQKESSRSAYMANREEYIERTIQNAKRPADKVKVKFYKRLRDLGFFPKESCRRMVNKND